MTGLLNVIIPGPFPDCGAFYSLQIAFVRFFKYFMPFKPHEECGDAVGYGCASMWTSGRIHGVLLV